jgi:hypothetical protein
MTFYKLLPQLPSPPQDMIDRVDRELAPAEMEVGYYQERFLTNWYGKAFPAARNIRIRNDEFAEWAKHNIIGDYKNAGLNYCNANPPAYKTSCGAHTDATRIYTLLYNVQTGGPDVTTCFWQEKGHPVIREPKAAGVDIDQLILLDSIQIPVGQWCILDTRILHSVENLVTARINFQISLDDHPW